MSNGSPAERLVGLTLPNDWVVVSSVERGYHNSGGHFSRCYVVERRGKRAFLKALDFSVAADAPDMLVAVQKMVDAYQFERSLLADCARRRLNRVVTAIEDGSVKVDDSPVIGTVHYLIFEPANGDVRDVLNASAALERAWVLRSLHNVATGLMQLHPNVAHQDTKPSNILVFEAEGSKIADLGSASIRGVESPRDGHRFAGDGTYAPPELLYGYQDPEWNRRRLACDVYLFGSMAVFFFASVGMTALLMSHLPPAQRPTANPWRGGWTGTYAEILPEVRHAFRLAVDEFAATIDQPKLKGTLTEMVAQLCDPDPLLRGHPRNRVGVGNPYSLERYVSGLDLLARRAELGILE